MSNWDDYIKEAASKNARTDLHGFSGFLEKRIAALEEERDWLLTACEEFVSSIKTDDASDAEADLIMAADAVRLRVQGYPVDLEEKENE